LPVNAGTERLRRARWVMRRMGHLILNLPRYIRIIVAQVEGMGEVRRHRYARAEKLLLRVYELLPPGEEATLITNLAMCLVSLRLGNPATAAELSLKAIRQAKVPGAYVGANAVERDYLRYYGKLIYEEATLRDGTPMMINVGIGSEADLDLDKVSARVKRDYPLTVVEPPPAHTLH
jgi:hypothetical protein